MEWTGEEAYEWSQRETEGNTNIQTHVDGHMKDDKGTEEGYNQIYIFGEEYLGGMWSFGEYDAKMRGVYRHG